MITHHKGLYFFPFLSRTDHKLYVYEGAPVVRCFHRKSNKFPEPLLVGEWSDRVSFVDSFINLVAGEY